LWGAFAWGFIMSFFDQLYAQLAIFPLRAILPGPACNCRDGADCERVGKHPACYWGKITPAHKCNGADGCPACFSTPVAMGGYGICTGIRSGIFIIDLDGREAIEAFYAMGPVPRTFVVHRGHERGHVYFNTPSFSVRTTASVLGPRIDVRGDGGFAVGPFSPHRSGLRYEIADDVAVADAPDWLLRLPGLHNDDEAPGPAPEPVAPGSPEEANRVTEAIEILREAADAVATQHDGDASNGVARWASLWVVSQKLVRVLELPLETSYALIVKHYNPRCSPLWSEREIWHKLTQARDYGHFETRSEVERFNARLLAAANCRGAA
jgi:Bifunctional DNA primase/polymerase, N-terminal